MAKGYQDPHFVEAKPSFIIKLHGADLLVAVGRELEIGWLPPLITQSRNAKIQPGGARLPRRVAECQDPRHADRAGHACDGRRPPAGQPAFLARSGQWPPHRPGGAGETDRTRSQPTPAYFAQRYADFDRRLTRGREAMAGGDGAIQGAEGRDVSPVVAELRRRLRPRRDRVRRAEAGNSAVAGAHARTRAADEGPEREDRAGRTVLRPQDAECHRPRHRCGDVW